MIYFLSFIWASFFARIADSCYMNKFLFLFLSMIAFIPMLLLSGLRDIEIGIDTALYPQTTFDFINMGYGLDELILAIGYIEPLYLALGYISLIILPNDIHSILFISSALTIGLFYAGMVRMRKYAPLWLSVFLFSFLFFNFSLNIQRQILAMSIVFFGFSFLIKGKVKTFIFSVVMAFFMHKSAIASFLCIPIFYMKNERYYNLLIWGLLIFSILYVSLISFFTSFDFFSKYEMYQQDNGFAGFFSISEFVLRLFFCYVIFLCARLKKNNVFYKGIKTVFICEFIINLLQIRSRYMGRLGYYLYDLYLIFMPYALYKINEQKSRTVLLKRTLILVVFYWWYVYIYSNAGGTYPYSSKILGI